LRLIECSNTQENGAAMSTQRIRNAGDPAWRRSDRMNDLLVVSSFGLWALLLGLAPVLAIHLLMGS
jgi:hypothetical protein